MTKDRTRDKPRDPVRIHVSKPSGSICGRKQEHHGQFVLNLTFFILTFLISGSEDKLTCTSDLVVAICATQPQPTPNSMSEGCIVKVQCVGFSSTWWWPYGVNEACSPNTSHQAFRELLMLSTFRYTYTFSSKIKTRSNMEVLIEVRPPPGLGITALRILKMMPPKQADIAIRG